MADPGIDTVLLDLDGTICNYRRDCAAVLEIAFDVAGVEPYFSPDDYFGRLRTLDGDFDTFRDHREACFVDLARTTGRDPAIGRAVARAFADERDQSNVAFCRDADRALDGLAARYSLGLVTNGGPDMQTQKLDALGIRKRFDAIVYAGYDTPPKPAPTPFERALEIIGSTPERAVHVGNSVADDVAGARAAGVTAIWIDDGTVPEPAPDLEIDSLGDLLERPFSAIRGGAR